MTSFDDRSDRQVVAGAAALVAVPRQEPADSFVLHAPLELAARARLLPHVRPERRALARARIDDLAARYAAAGDPVAEPPRRSAAPASVADSPEPELVTIVRDLGRALAEGELDRVDELATSLAARIDAASATLLLAGDLTDRLAAAGHAPILLWLLRRADPSLGLPVELVRGPLRELARNPEWRFRWPDRVPSAPADGPSLARVIAATPRLGSPGSDFVFPTMLQVDPAAGGPPTGGGSTGPDGADPELGVAGTLLAPVVGIDPRGGGGAPSGIAERAATVRRLAAWTMLLEPPDHAPYGWTHALTIPQAVLGIADAVPDPGRSLAVAASHLVGFRAALARRPLELDDPAAAAFPAGDPGAGTFAALDEALTTDPGTAAAAVWFAPEALLEHVTVEVATRASARRDAHLVKYALACLDAAATDPADRRLFLAAASALVAWWHAVPEPDDPLLDRALATR